jgi:hypothetical protein
MAMARLSSSPPRRILLFILLVFLLAFVPFSAGQMSSHAEDDEAGDATVVRTENESYHRRSKLLVSKDDVLPKTQGGEDEVEVKEGWGGRRSGVWWWRGFHRCHIYELVHDPS